jgi:aspartate/methionine/tyrosine aminotransferase
MLLLAKMLEVCSTTLPQKVLPTLYQHAEFKPLLASRIHKYQQRAEEAYQFLKNIPQVRINKPRGVFYLVVELLDLPYAQLEAKNKAIRLYLNDLEQSALQKGMLQEDFQFAYELMGSQGICVVPLSGFGSHLNGFRMTLLQNDAAIFTQILQQIALAISEYYGESS